MTAPYSYNFTPAAAGTFTLSSRAYDNVGAQTTSNSVTVTATTAAPVVNLPRITLSLSNTLVAPGTTITLTGAATATAPVTVSKVSFYMNGTLLSEDTTSPYNATATLPSSGTYTFYARVTDSLNQVKTTLDQVAVVQTAPAVVTTDADVWRLLNQATFGASQAEAARVNALGIAGWIDDQFAQADLRLPGQQVQPDPAQHDGRLHDADARAAATIRPTRRRRICSRDHLTLAMVQRDFFTNALAAPDQLRQRVAWALSQIIVTSANEQDLSYAHVMSRFQNILFQEAFGNYENLLLKVTYNPAMGNYLDMVNNDRPAGARVPNENYAREILQLFSVGLYELNADGSPILDAANQPVATYDQADIVEFSRVFTGYTYSSAANPAGPANGKQARYYGRQHGAVPDHRDRGPRSEPQDAAERHGAAGRPDGQGGHRRRGAQRVHASEHRSVRGAAADPAPRDRQSVEGLRRPRLRRVRQQRRWRSRRPQGRRQGDPDWTARRAGRPRQRRTSGSCGNRF